MIKKRSFWLAVFIIATFLFSMPSLSGSSNSAVSSTENTEIPDEITNPVYEAPVDAKASPAPHSTGNVTIYTEEGDITHGTWDLDSNGLWDFFYINVTIDVHVTGPFFAAATLNYSHPNPNQDDFIAITGLDYGLFEAPGGDGPQATFGDTIGIVERTIAFFGDEINATGISDEVLVVTGIVVVDTTLLDQVGEDPFVGTVGDPAIGDGPWTPSTSDVYNTTRGTPQRYYANEFEPWKYAYVYENEWNDFAIDADGDSVDDYLVLEVLVNASADFRVRFEVELQFERWAENVTNLVKGDNTVQLYFRAQDLPLPGGSGPFNVTGFMIEKWDTTWGDYWSEIYDEWVEDGDPYIYSTINCFVSDPWEYHWPHDTYIIPDNSSWTLTPILNTTSTLYYQIRVDVQLNVSAYGMYTVRGDLGPGGDDWYDSFHLQTENTTWLGRGDSQTISLVFDTGLLHTLPIDVGISILGSQALANSYYNLTHRFNYLRVELFDTRDNFMNSHEDSLNHTKHLIAEDFDPVPFIDLTAPFTDTVSMLYGDPLSYWMNISSDIIDNVLNVTLDYPWYDDYWSWDGAPFWFEVQLLDANWSEIGGDWNAQGGWWQLSSPESIMYGLDVMAKGDYRFARLIVRNHIQHETDPIIPQWVDVSIHIDTLNDADNPSSNLIAPTTSPPNLKDEFGFLVNGTASDPTTGVARVDFFLSGLSPTAPFASSDPWYWYDFTDWNGPDNITMCWFEDGQVTFYAHPANWEVGGTTQTLSMVVTDYGLNTYQTGVAVYFEDVPPPTPDDMILNGLNWIVTQQQPDDGSYLWSREDQRGHDDPGSSTPSFTAWAMLTLLQNGSRYDDPVVQACWNYIASQVRDDGGIYSYDIHAPNYETAISLMGLIPLAISYAAHGAANTTLTNAIINGTDFLLEIQNLEHNKYYPGDNEYGGWGYGYPEEQHWADLSNSQWSIIALAAARDYGITAAENQTMWTAAEDFVRQCYAEGNWYWNGTHDVSSYGFSYQANDIPEHGWPQATMTGAGIWCLALMGYDDSDEMVKEALNWMDLNWPQYIQDTFSGMGYQYYALLSAAKALLLTGHASSPQYGLMYASINEFLGDHVIQGQPGYWFWDNTPGSEDPVYATLLAVLSQQISYGVVGEADRLAITASCQVHLHVFGPDDQHYGYDYKTGLIETEGESTYSGLDSYPQQIIIKTPEKGTYHVVVFPVENGDFNVTVAGVTTDNTTIAIHYLSVSGATLGEAYESNVTLTTIYGVNIFAEPFEELPEGDAKLNVIGYTVGDIDYETAPDSLEIAPGDSFTVQMEISLVTGTSAESAIATAYVYSNDISLDKTSISLGNITNNASFEWYVTVDGSATNLDHTIWISVIAENIGAPLIIPCVFTVNSSITPSGYTIEVLQPNGGETLSGSYQIKWNATGPSGTSLSYKIEYSADGGGIWESIATGVAVQQYEWDTTSVENSGNYLVRVTIIEVSISDTSDSTFSIDNKIEKPSTTPGFELLVTILGLITLPLLARRVRKH